LLFQSPSCADVFRDWIDRQNSGQQRAIAEHVAGSLSSPWAYVEGFALWLSDLAMEESASESVSEIARIFASAAGAEALDLVYSKKQPARVVGLLWSVAIDAHTAGEDQGTGGIAPGGPSRVVKRMLRMIDAIGAPVEEKSRAALEAVEADYSEPALTGTVHFCWTMGGAWITRALDLLRRLGPGSAGPLEHPRGQLARALASAGEEAVSPIIDQLRDGARGVVPLVVALGEIGDSRANEALQELAQANGAGTLEGAYSRKALTLCGAPLARDLALEALQSDNAEARRLGLWMVRHGACDDAHPAAAKAARALAEEGALDPEGVEALAACAGSATPESWKEVGQAFEFLLNGRSSVWCIAPMIGSGLPQAPRMVLERAGELWSEGKRDAAGIRYGIDAIGEQALTPEQVRDLVGYAAQLAQDSPVIAALDQAAREGVRLALDVLAGVAPARFAEALGAAFQAPHTCREAARIVRCVPVPGVTKALAEQAALGPGGQARLAFEALCAMESHEGLNGLVEALRRRDAIDVREATVFADVVARLGRTADCIGWACDAGEAKCLRQAAARALGHALRGDGSQTGCVDALRGLLVARDETVYAAALGAAAAAHAELLEPLMELSRDPDDGYCGLVGLSGYGSDDALRYAIQRWYEMDLYEHGGEATLAACAVAGRVFADPARREGPCWKEVSEWLHAATARFLDPRGTRTERRSDGGEHYSHMGTDEVLGNAILGLVAEWEVAVCLRVIEQHSLGDEHAAWLSTPVRHHRWAILARHRPSVLVRIAEDLQKRGLSRDNEPWLCRALLSVGEASYRDRALALATEIAIRGRAAERRAIAQHIAELAPEFASTLPPNAAHARLLRDVAISLGPGRGAETVLERLAGAPGASARQLSTDGRTAIEEHARGAEALRRFLATDVPHERLWWCSTAAACASKGALKDLEPTAAPELPLSAQFALADVGESIERRDKRRDQQEDRNGERGVRPWVWGQD